MVSVVQFFLSSPLIVFLFCPTGFAQKNIDRSFRSVFDPAKGEWNIAWPGRVSQYDLVYLSPPIDPMQGIPLGNGDVGVLFWCEGSKIIAVVNKSDLWDDAAFGSFQKKDEEHNTTLRHAYRIVIDFKLPIFDYFYLSDFKAKLNLSDASLDLYTSSEFGKGSMHAFVDKESGSLFLKLSSNLRENVPIEITVERFGSRIFARWFTQIDRDASIGLSGTDASSDDTGVYISQRVASGTFAGGGRVISDNGLTVSYSRLHSRTASMTLSGDREKSAELAFVVTSPLDTDPIPEVRLSLDTIAEKGRDSFLNSNAALWKSIWMRSFIDYGDDYLNNLWHLTMYYAHASQGGKYPGRFVNGLWGWSRDVQNWSFYFHQNQQELYWPLNAAGFHDLIDSYLNFRFNSLGIAKNDAKNFFKANGAFISDVTERRGYNSLGESANHTPVAEIAMEFWRQYQFTGDKKFLREKAVPFIIEAARFFESLFVKEADGLYHAKEGTGYEGSIRLRDGLTELVCGRVLFATALEALKITHVDLKESSKWREILENLAPLPVVETDEKTISPEGSNFTLKRGFFKGAGVQDNKIFAAGWGVRENTWLTVYQPSDDTTMWGLKLLDGIFPTVPSSPVFPSGLIGLRQKGDTLFNHMKTTALLYGSEITGWDPVPIVLARLGLREELAADLERFPDRWQIYCNGWGHWGLEHEVYGKDYHNITKDAENYFRTYEVQGVSGEEKFPIRMWPLRYTSMEAMSMLATAMNESLLQSHDGILRVAPAFRNGKSGRFTLHAIGGFVVSTEIKSGQVQWISINSKLGNTFKLELPWSKGVIHSDARRNTQRINGHIVEVKTKTHELITIYPEGKNLQSWSVAEEVVPSNEKVKYHSLGRRLLGIPRMY